MKLKISKSELGRRREKVSREMADRGLDGLCLFSSTSIFYLTGFYFIPTERPAALVLDADGTPGLFLPRLELEHAKARVMVGRIESYPEYPGERHPMYHLADFIRSLGLGGGRLGVDADGYGSPYGYRGPALSEVLEGAEIVKAGDLVERMRAVKSPEEIELIRESARWGNLAHALLQEYAGAGKTELEISMRASLEATITMTRALGPEYEPIGGFGGGAFAGFRGQVGPNSALPHAVTINAVLMPGDTLVTGATASVWGYGSELERTMFVGEPSSEQRRFFELMVRMQDIAFEAIGPGRKCSEVDRAVMDFVKAEGLQEYWRHHTGHALGLGMHEAPFFDVGDDTVLEPGMVFSVEPGLYVQGLGGFRHSDTVLVTEEGVELLTYYPRDLESLIV